MGQETPVLTKKQQKSSLSAKKTKTKQTIRNVLATPFAKYWPLTKEEHVEVVHDILSKHLPRILPKKVQIPYKDIKQIPKSERKAFRASLAPHDPDFDPQKCEKRDGLVFGINDVTRAIEEGIVKSVLITHNVVPKLMVEHVIDQCVLLRIPVLVVLNLKDLLKDKCGLSSVAMAITNTTTYDTIQKMVEQVHKKYPVPRNHINFQRSLDLLNSTTVVIDDSILDNTADISFKETAESPEEKNVYLYRKANKERVFVPKQKPVNSAPVEVTSRDFLSFSVDESSSLPIVDAQNDEKMQEDAVFLPFVLDSAPNVSVKPYTPLKVKRVKGDVNRNKRKIEEMKQRAKKKKGKKRRKNQQ